MNPNNTIKPGLAGVIAAQTRLSHVEGDVGRLTIAGFPLEELADKATFEETVYLLWRDSLPNAQALTDFKQELQSYRTLPAATLELLRQAAQAQVSVIDALRMAASSLSLMAPDHNPAGDPVRDARLVVAAFPPIVAAYWRLRHNEELIAPRADLDHAANFLFMLTGEVPSPEYVRGLETYLNTVVD
ncbi:MAG TPA: citrate/2-methylcitrate synthase, partial [Anaerolineae bacterium]|nr:citrate/2-methylcitrate synthase [Anaerolineae bacterium]